MDSHTNLKAKEKKAAKIEFKGKLNVFPFKLNWCDKGCMERNNMKKHINNKHDEEKGNVCQKMFATSLEILQHVANEHLQDEASEED